MRFEFCLSTYSSHRLSPSQMVRFVCVNFIDCKQQIKYILWLIMVYHKN